MKRRCLVILDVPPVASGLSGWSPRYAALVKALAAEFEVTVRLLQGEAEAEGTAAVAAGLPAQLTFELITVPKSALTRSSWPGKIARLRHLMTARKPLACQVHAPREVARRATEGRWDVAIVCLPWLAHLATRLEAAVVYSFVEERWERVLYRTTAALPAPLRRAVTCTEMLRFESLYRRAVRRGARLVAISLEEAADFDRTVGAGHTRCVPHGLERVGWALNERAEREVDVLTYGTVSVNMNGEQLRATIDALSVRAQVRWVVLCQRSVPQWLQVRRSVVTVVDVDDVRPHLVRAKVCFVPSEFSTGVRTTILEAWAMGCAVVTSAGGERGLPVGADAAVWVGATPGECARLIQELLLDDQRRAEVAERGRHLVTTKADLDTIMQRFVQDHLVA